MKGMNEAGESCPFEFNFDPDSFKVGDTVSYRVTGSLDGFPFAGTLLEVHPDHVIISADADTSYRGTRESRPVVDGSQI